MTISQQLKFTTKQIRLSVLNLGRTPGKKSSLERLSRIVDSIAAEEADEEADGSASDRDTV